ncbi:MAG: hypothetical protein WDZ61_00275, partial [Parcubacteria group bacterium]
MKRPNSRNKAILSRLGAVYMTAALVFAGFPLSIFAQTAPTVDIKANGQDGTVEVVNGESWNYSWTSSNATACQIETPTGVSGISLAGNDGPIPADHPWYPSVGNPTTLTLTCTDGTNVAVDSATVRIVTGGGGGGGGGDDISADIKINGQDGLVTITQGEVWNYSWTSDSATACQLTSPTGVSGISLAGNDGPIPADHPWYPAVGSSTTLTISCTDGTDSVSDSVTVLVVAATTGGGGEATDISTDIKINGQDGTVTINAGESWNYSWTSDSATACQLTSPTGVSGISL